MTVFDNELMFRTTGTLTVSESNGPLTIRGTPIQGIAARVVVPSADGALGTVLPRYYGSDDNSTYYLFATYPGGASVIPTGGKTFITPLVNPGYKYIKEELVIADTTPGFGTVISGLVSNVGEDWTRVPDWT